MLRRLFLFLALGTLTLASAQTAQRGPAADRYHEAARLFIDGETERAAQAADAGLAMAPDNARLQALRDLIRQQEQQDEQNQGDDGEPQTDDSGEQEQEGEGQPRDDGAGETPPEREQAPSDRQQPPSQPQDGSDPADGDRQPGEAPPSAGDPNRMSRDQAERLLEAVAGDERLLLEEMRRAPSRVRRNEKDW
jgi:hypothetical protein